MLRTTFTKFIKYGSVKLLPARSHHPYISDSLVWDLFRLWKGKPGHQHKQKAINLQFLLLGRCAAAMVIQKQWITSAWFMLGFMAGTRAHVLHCFDGQELET